MGIACLPKRLQPALVHYAPPSFDPPSYTNLPIDDILGMRTTLLAFLLGASLTLATQAPVDPVALKSAPTALERLKLLADKDLVFDFFNPKGGIVKGQGGQTVAANAVSFPALIGSGVALVLGQLGPCGYNSPHIHPRANEFLINLNSTSLATGMFSENGGRLVSQNLQPGQATLFPQGSAHFQMNLDCHPTTFLAALSSEDFGTLQLAQGFLGQLPQDAVLAALGDEIGYEYLPELISKIPANVALGTKECLKRCGIERPPTSVEVKSPKSVGVPSNFEPERAAAAAEKPKALAASNDLKAAAAVDNSALSFEKDSTHSSVLPLTIALAVINGILAAALIAMAAFVLFRRRSVQKFSPLRDQGTDNDAFTGKN